MLAPISSSIPSPRQQLGEGVGHLGLGGREQPVAPTSTIVTRAPRRAERLAELQPDRPGADHQQPLGQLAQRSTSALVR